LTTAESELTLALHQTTSEACSRRKFIGIAILIMSMSPATKALDIYKIVSQNSSVSWIMFYAEDDRWLVDEIDMDRLGWPRLSSRKIFRDASVARAAMTGQGRNLELTHTLPESNEELRGAAGESLWPVTEEWSWEWEVKYARWVNTELDRSWWIKNGLATDCADVA